jgi:hypothetical protein
MTVAVVKLVSDKDAGTLAFLKVVGPTVSALWSITVSFTLHFKLQRLVLIIFFINKEPQCSCPEKTIPNPTPLVGCVREPKVCSGNRDCVEGYFCDTGYCLPICSSNNNCFSNEICEKGLCKPVCRTDGDCRSGEVCDGLSCIPGCRSDDACLDTQVCSNNKCKRDFLLTCGEKHAVCYFL